MRDRWEQLVDQFGQVIQDPQANPRMTVLFIAMGVVLVLVLVTALIAFLTVGDEPKKKRGRRRTPWTLRIGVLILCAGLYMAVNEATTSPWMCDNCHELAPAVRSWEGAEHSTADCLACHQPAGITGHVSTRLVALGDLVSHYRNRGASPMPKVTVTNDGCVDCHATVLSETVDARNVRVRHSDFLALGVRCTQCHGSVGHGDRLGSPEPTMDKCVYCHDGREAPNTCDVCHLTDLGAVRKMPSDYPKVQLGPPTTCEGCHPTDTCRECHQVDMPHSPEFVAGGHAREAAFERKEEVCLLCHRLQMCRRCHTGADLTRMPWAHVETWKEDHQTGLRSGCRGCHGVEDMCALCHD